MVLAVLAAVCTSLAPRKRALTGLETVELLNAEFFKDVGPSEGGWPQGAFLLTLGFEGPVSQARGASCEEPGGTIT